MGKLLNTVQNTATKYRDYMYSDKIQTKYSSEYRSYY